MVFVFELILKSLSLVADTIVVFPLIRKSRYRKLVPSQLGAADLVWLVNHLGEMLGRLGLSQNEMVRKIEGDLGSVLWNVYAAVLPYVEIYSKSEVQQASALRNLSQVEEDGEMKRAETIINGIASNPLIPKGTREVAEAALEEIRERIETMRKKIVEGNKN